MTESRYESFEVKVKKYIKKNPGLIDPFHIDDGICLTAYASQNSYRFIVNTELWEAKEEGHHQIISATRGMLVFEVCCNVCQVSAIIKQMVSAKEPENIEAKAA